MTRKDIYEKVQKFLVENADAPSVWRAGLVRTLTDELDAAGCDHARYWTLTMRHPALLRKSAKQFSIGDILADFIMNIDEVAERSAEYPVHGPEREYRQEEQRMTRELLLRSERAEGYAPGTVYEDTFAVSNPVESALFDALPNMTADELRAELTAIQRHPDDFIARYADGSVWNRAESRKWRTPADVREAIERLDMRRIRVCAVCGNAFYSHSPQYGRVKACDVMPHLKRREMSACQVAQDNALALLRKRKAANRAA